MNSKEAIKNIKRTMIINRNGNIDVGNKYNKESLTIERDLEVVEILKRMVIARKGTTWYYLNTEHPFFESQEDIDKVKEWLENGKIN